MTNAEVSNTRTFVSVLSGGNQLTLSKASLSSLAQQPEPRIGLRFGQAESPMSGGSESATSDWH
jgi:hypothetical protein